MEFKEILKENIRESLENSIKTLTVYHGTIPKFVEGIKKMEPIPMEQIFSESNK